MKHFTVATSIRKHGGWENKLFIKIKWRFVNISLLCIIHLKWVISYYMCWFSFMYFSPTRNLWYSILSFDVFYVFTYTCVKMEEYVLSHLLTLAGHIFITTNRTLATRNKISVWLCRFKIIFNTSSTVKHHQQLISTGLIQIWARKRPDSVSPNVRKKQNIQQAHGRQIWQVVLYERLELPLSSFLHSVLHPWVSSLQAWLISTLQIKLHAGTCSIIKQKIVFPTQEWVHQT